MAHTEEDLLRAAALENVKATLAARQRAEQALEQRTNQLARSLALVRATLESSVSGILVTDQEGTITDFNKKYLQMWPVPRALVETHSHRRVLEGIAAEFADPRDFLDGVERIYRDSPAESFDVLELKDGRTIERFTKTQIVDGREAGRVWSFRDITAHKRTEASLREETRILEVLNRTGASLASELDLQALLQTVTDAATQVTGAQFGAFFYHSTDADDDEQKLFTLSGASREAFKDLGYPRESPLFDPAFKGGSPIRLDDVLKDPRYGQMPRHHGIPGHVSVRSYLAVPVISRSSEVIGGLLFGHAQPRQFTARHERLVVAIAAQGAIAIDNARLYESERAARSAAERMSDMKDRFLANLSHELRTPLNAVLGWAQILRRGVKDETDLKNGLEAIERSARVQSQLIGDLLDTSRITSGKVRLDVQPLTPISFIDAALETVRPAAEAKGIRLLSILDPVTSPIAGDPARLQQVMWNLLSNAIKFTPKGGQVSVSLERVNSQIEIAVTDTGIGIKPEFVPHVFERFQQGDLSTTKAHGGLGLGLSIVRQLVELHGGTVTASSPGQDQGATFALRLPVTAVRFESSSEERLHPETWAPVMAPFEDVDLSGVNVLVVDDDQDARDLIRRLLSDCGAEVRTAATAAEAMAQIALEAPDILVSDIGMPNVDGFELLKMIRNLNRDGTKKMPAVALTAFARSEDRTRALRAGFVAHVAKPVEPSELLATIAAFCNRAG